MPRLKIRTSLLTMLMSLIVLLVAAILLVNVRAGQAIAEDLGNRYLDKTRDLVGQELNSFFQPVMTSLKHGREWARHGVVEPRDMEKSNAVYLPVLNTLRQVTSIATGNVDGYSYRVGAHKGGYKNRLTYAGVPGKPADYAIHEVDGSLRRAYTEPTKFDPRQRPWYDGARARLDEANGDVAATMIFWTAPFILNTSKNPGIAASLPYEGPNKDLYMMTFNVMLTKLSNFTASLRPSPEGMAMVLTEDGRIVGFPATEQYDTADKRLAHIKSLGNRMPKLNEIGHSALDAAAGQWDSIQAGGVAARRRIDVAGEPWRMIFERFVIEEGPSLWIGVAVPEADFLGQVRRQQRNILWVSGLALLIALALAMLLARLYGKPLRQLAAASERISALDLTPGEKIESHVLETHLLAESQENMRAALESFSKYIPTAVVQELLRRGEAAQLGGKSIPISVLFTDIRNFTTISEGMTPGDLVAHLAEYFQSMMDIIRSEGGAVDKVIGDAIMAMWGAPIESEHHARHAVLGALKCIAFVREFNERCLKEGRPPLWTGFGIASGTAFVGNFGAPTRLNYSALGDVVNLAARLEGATKMFGGTMLCSQETMSTAGDDIAWLRVARVGVQGKTKPESIFEPLGMRSEVDPDVLRNVKVYEDALAKYEAGDFAAAQALLGTIDDDSPVRVIATLLTARCIRFASESQSEDWDGVWWLDSK